MVSENEDVMAAAEARAAWQRTANRYLVQEDAKRAPKLACCPSSSSMQQYDSNGGNAANEQDHSAVNIMPLNWNSTNSTPPDKKWWLQMEPNFGSQKDFAREQLNALEGELQEVTTESSFSTSKLNGGAVDHNRSDTSVESPWMVSTAFMKPDSRTGVEGMKTATNVSQQPLKRKIDMGDYFCHDKELMDWKRSDLLTNKKTEKASPDLEIPWVGGNKCEPWWRISDRDELALLVAQKSLEHIENCDLPRPTQTMPVTRDPLGCLERLDGNNRFFSPAGCKLHTSMCNTVGCPQNSFSSGNVDETHCSSSEVRHLTCDTKKLHSGARAFQTTADKDMEENMILESDPSRSQLLEALRRSQTRARKAEIAAQQACDEKEDIVNILFRQASHLFAYKQWLHMLQLENLCLQLRIKEQKLAALFPTLSWMPLERNALQWKGKKQKKCSLCNYAVFFAVGLGLAGAGLVVGWTLGWLLSRL